MAALKLGSIHFGQFGITGKISVILPTFSNCAKHVMRIWLPSILNGTPPQN